MKKSKFNIPWIVGGNIPAEDVSALRKTGAVEAFPTGTRIETVVGQKSTVQVLMEFLMLNGIVVQRY